MKVEAQTQPQTSIENSAMVAGAAKTEKPIVLEYRLETIEVPGPGPVAESASVTESNEKSGLRKVIDFAWDAKNSDGPLANMRQAKDELFALNFKKDKQKNPK
jgi:hypothetical protein